MDWSNRGILSALHLQLDSRQDVLKFLHPQVFNLFSQGSGNRFISSFRSRTCPKTSSTLGFQRICWDVLILSPSSRALSSRSLVTMGRIPGCGFVISNCIGAITQEGLSFKLYISCLGAADGNNTKHSLGSE